MNRRKTCLVRPAAPFLRWTVIATLFGLAASAQAADIEAPPHVFLDFDAGDQAEHCISKPELERAVQAELGRMVFVTEASSATTSVVVRLERHSGPQRIRAIVSLSAAAPDVTTPEAPGTGAREIETGGDCHALDQELALVVALLVDSDAQSPAPAVVEEEVAPPPSPPPPVPPDDGPVSSAPSWEARTRGPVRVELEAAGLVSFGTLPSVGAGVELGVLVTPPGWPGMRARVAGFLPSAASAGANGSVEILRGEAGLAVCPTLAEASSFELRGCLGLDAVLMRATPSGLTGEDAVSRLDVRLVASIRGALRLSDAWRTVLALGAGIPSRVYRFSYDDPDGQRQTAFKEAEIPLWASLGLAREFR